ncbi:MAG TPA: CHASE3 domain-containing protein, partial [Tepidisphaeraceae bacterium]
VVVSLVDAETGQRGYVITGSTEYLAPYQTAVGRIAGQLNQLDRLVRGQAVEEDRVAQLRRLVDARLAELERTIALRGRAGFDAARDEIRADLGKTMMDDARRVADDMRRTEEATLALRTAERDASARTAVTTLIGSALFNLLLLALIAWAVRRDAAARAAALAERQRQLELQRDNARLAADVEQRRRTNETLTALTTRLEQSNRELQDFASVASHDLQEPLRKIQAFGDRLRTRFAAPLGPDGQDYVDRMHAAASRMQTLINDLLAFSRITTGAQPFEKVDLGDVAAGVLSDLEARIEHSGGRVEVGPLPTIQADPLQMRQLLQNLIANALKFQRPNVPPIVQVTAETTAAAATTTPGEDDARRRQGPACQIRIADNGIGFDEKYLDRIFNVFQRLHGRNEYEGTGIGLAVCRKITERHGGTITATSRPGEGSTFVVTLPVNQLQAPGDLDDVSSSRTTRSSDDEYDDDARQRQAHHDPARR